MERPDTGPAHTATPPAEPSRSAAADTRVVLLGMMGAGKTTVGRLLAARGGGPYLDNDDLVRARSGREPADIRARDGEAALHALERQALADALLRPVPSVVGAAAAVVEDPEALAALERDVAVVWLRARPETLRARIGSGEGRRAEATDLAWLTRQARAREDAYRRAADLIVDVDELSPDQVATRILGWLATRRHGGSPSVGRRGDGCRTVPR